MTMRENTVMSDEERCNCPCHEPNSGILHFMPCCSDCFSCHEQRIIDLSKHRCAPIHLGLEMMPVGLELACGTKGPFPAYEKCKERDRRYLAFVRQGDRASVFFSLKPEKATCPECIANNPYGN